MSIMESTIKNWETMASSTWNDKPCIKKTPNLSSLCISSIYNNLLINIINPPLNKEMSITVFPLEKKEFIPRTSLGKKLMFLRKKAITLGMKLLNEDEILAEVRTRRGELVKNETDIY